MRLSQLVLVVVKFLVRSSVSDPAHVLVHTCCENSAVCAIPVTLCPVIIVPTPWSMTRTLMVNAGHSRRGTPPNEGWSLTVSDWQGGEAVGGRGCCYTHSTGGSRKGGTARPACHSIHAATGNDIALNPTDPLTEPPPRAHVRVL